MANDILAVGQSSLWWQMIY